MVCRVAKKNTIDKNSIVNKNSILRKFIKHRDMLYKYNGKFVSLLKKERINDCKLNMYEYYCYYKINNMELNKDLYKTKDILKYKNTLHNVLQEKKNSKISYIEKYISDIQTDICIVDNCILSM
jgi:hypothetical protein